MTLTQLFKVNLWQVISQEPFDLQPSYLAQGDKLTSSISSISLSDLEQLVKVNLWQAISQEPFDLQPSYLAQVDKLTSSISSISLSDLELTTNLACATTLSTQIMNINKPVLHYIIHKILAFFY